MTQLVAEFCQNHNGDRKILAEMIAAAAENGATHAKIQSIWADDLTKRKEFEEGIVKRPYEPEYKRLKGLELSIDDHYWFIEECERKHLVPFTTIFAKGRIAEIAKLPWPGRLVKVASYDCASIPLLKALRENFETIFVSTGATFDEEIERAAELLQDRKMVFFHCVTMYPNPLPECNLARLRYLRKFSTEVGWSDHTAVAKDGVKAAKAALALGANYVERHFTVLPADKTKDGPVSITPGMLKELAEFAKKPREEEMDEVSRTIPEFKAMIGREVRPLSDTELLNRDYYRGRFATHVKGKIIFNWDE